MELYRGMDNKGQLAQMIKRVKGYNILDFNEDVSVKAVELIQSFKLSHNLQIPDAIIGALRINYDIPLFTYNVKDFKFMPGLILYTPVF